jgi:2-methylcitrate dehydratase
MGQDGKTALRGMLLIDEIRGRLAEVFSLKTYKIDHVVHGRQCLFDFQAL